MPHTQLKHAAATCLKATPTIFMPRPLWLRAEEAPWTCIRTAPPRLLHFTDACETCPKWQPHPDCVETLPDTDACR
jgi:hypothetical protein